MTREDRINYWQGILEEHRHSGLSAAAFCREHQINRDRFYWWRKRLENNNGHSKQSGFLELVPSCQSKNSGIRICLPGNIYVELEQGFDPATLRLAIETLYAKGNSPCLP
jgi:hypothetical protein